MNGEPTDNRLAAATRGVLRVRLKARGRAAHSAFPELGESAIDRLLDALMVIRGLQFPDDPLLGRTHYTVGLIEGGVAPNVVSPHASAELMFRIVGDAATVREALRVVEGLVEIEHVHEVPAIRMHTVDGFETAVFPFATDVPLLGRWGTPLLVGPGSIHVAHTDEEHVAVDELCAAVDRIRKSREAAVILTGLVGRIAARTLCNFSLRTASGPEGSSAKQTLRCAAGAPGRGGAHQHLSDFPLTFHFHFNVCTCSMVLPGSRPQVASAAVR